MTFPLSILILLLLALPAFGQNGGSRTYTPPSDSARLVQDSIMRAAHRAIARDSTLIEEYQKILTVLKARRRYDEELMLAEQMVQANPSSAIAHFSFGDAQLDNVTPELAMVSLSRALLIQPTFVRARVALAEAYMMTKSYDTALSHLDTALLHNPRYAQAHIQRASLLTQLGREPEALENYRAASELLPDSFTHWLRLGRLLVKMAQYDEAIDALEYATVLNAESSDAYYFHAQALAGAGRKDEAIRAYNDFWMRFPRDHRALEAERIAREMTGQP